MEFFLLCLLWLSLATVSILFLQLFKKTSPNHLPPGPRPLPIIGNLLDLGTAPHRNLARLAKAHGPLMSLRLGSVLTVVASTPDAARDILQKHDAICAARSIPDVIRACDHCKTAIGWLPPGPHWRSLRKICSNELFAPHRLDALQSLRREKVEQLLEYIGQLSSKGEAVDIGRVVLTTSLNLMSRTTFSVDLAELETVSSQEFMDVITGIMETAGKPNVSDFFPVLMPADLQGLKRRMTGYFSRMYRMFDEKVEQRLRDLEANQPARHDFLDLLLDSRLQDGSVMDRQTLKSLLTDLFTAGSDTTAVTVEWAMAELLQNPQIMAKARDELARVIGSRKEVDESDISQLPYLQAIVKETLRVHPPGPLLIPHQAEATVEMGGYIIPKGTRMLVNVWAVGRNDDAWAEPEKFIPERFLVKDFDFRGRDFEYIPFGAGRRICPGMPLADRMVHLVLGSLLHRFEWKLPKDIRKSGVDMSEKFGVSLAMAVHLQAIAILV